MQGSPGSVDIADSSTSLGKYRLIAELGQGGMAQVFLALVRGHAGFNKLVVIKQLREQLAEDPEFLSMFLDEARLAARLNHPNVVQTNEVGEDGHRYFIAMEYLEGQPLNRIVQRAAKQGGIPVGLHLRIMAEILAGLQHAHELVDFDGTPLCVVHRDMTPHNAFVTYSGQVKVVDFGIAKAVSQSAETKTGVLKGKVAYMAPEQARGEKVDRRADLFSVGVMMWEALTGRRLFKGLPEVVILQKIILGEIDPPRKIKPDINAGLEAVCLKALAPNRDDRYESAADMQAALEEALDAAGERALVRDAGKLVTNLFQAERAKIASLIESQLSGIRASGEHPIVEISTVGKIGDTRSRIPIIADPTSLGDHSHSGTPSLVTPPPMSGRTTLTSSTGTGSIEITPPPRKKLLFPIVGLGIGAAAAITYLVVSASHGPAAATPPVASTAAAPASPAAHVLKLESSPAGATITEGGKEIGKTPMAITLDPGQKDARIFVVAADGYQPYTLRQEAATEDTKIVVPLTPAPAANAPATATSAATTVAAAPWHPGGGAAKPPPPPATATAAPAQPTSTALQIRINR